METSQEDYRGRGGRGLHPGLREARPDKPVNGTGALSPCTGNGRTVYRLKSPPFQPGRFLAGRPTERAKQGQESYNGGKTEHANSKLVHPFGGSRSGHGREKSRLRDATPTAVLAAVVNLRTPAPTPGGLDPHPFPGLNRETARPGQLLPGSIDPLYDLPSRLTIPTPDSPRGILPALGEQRHRHRLKKLDLADQSQPAPPVARSSRPRAQGKLVQADRVTALQDLRVGDCCQTKFKVNRAISSPN